MAETTGDMTPRDQARGVLRNVIGGEDPEAVAYVAGLIRERDRLSDAVESLTGAVADRDLVWVRFLFEKAALFRRGSWVYPGAPLIADALVGSAHDFLHTGCQDSTVGHLADWVESIHSAPRPARDEAPGA